MKTFLFILNLFLALTPALASSGGGGPTRGAACFYTGRNFTGAALCARQGERIDNLAGRGFNNKISSIEFFGNARSVIVCENSYFTGRCFEYFYDVWNFDGLNLNNEISSLEVR